MPGAQAPLQLKTPELLQEQFDGELAAHVVGEGLPWEQDPEFLQDVVAPVHLKVEPLQEQLTVPHVAGEGL